MVIVKRITFAGLRKLVANGSSSEGAPAVDDKKGNGWSEYQYGVLDKLEDHSQAIGKIGDQITENHKEAMQAIAQVREDHGRELSSMKGQAAGVAGVVSILIGAVGAVVAFFTSRG